MKLENIGAIKQFTLPDDWQERRSGAALGVRWERIFQPAGAHNVEINISYRGVPLDEASRKVFSYVLKQGEKNDFDLEEVLALRTVMGMATTGDNQYTNTNPLDSLEGPNFELTALAVRTVAGRLVLRVEGKFKNNRIYSGMFYQAGSEGKMVEEFFLQATTRDEFEHYKPIFDGALNSIVWR
ncbi:hypothetical protein KF913_07345 [Candidatus Obscuribacterales bacterium]|nr:hypothetical protein [Candidatus Obscuribacterales bacterium]